MDITNFMQWFINQVITLFTQIFNLMNSIEFMGTSLLKLILTIVILSTIIPVLFTIIQRKDIQNAVSYNDRVKEKNEREYNKAK